MEIAINKLAIICFLITGVSHIFQPRVWVRFFSSLHRKGEVGSFLNALLHLLLGLVIVSFHNIWQGTPTLLTLVGWGLVVKSLFYFVFPGYGLKLLGRVSIERDREFVIAGFFSLALAGLLTYILLTR